MKKLMLLILDGWGINLEKNKLISAINKAKTPFIDYCYNKYINSQLEASGNYVGLPKGQMGNSEVGHINLGSGRKVIQSLEKINIHIKNGLLETKLNDLFKRFSFNKKKIHFIGLLSDGGVHSHMNHLFYLLKIFNKKNIKNIFIHVFTDGRDSSSKNSIIYIKKLLNKTKKYGGKLSSVIGRFYSMDRNKRWNRTKIAYNAMVNCKGIHVCDIFNYIENCYKKKNTDEFLYPAIITNKDGIPITKIENDDIVFCFNFRPDRSRQIIEYLTGYNNKYNKIKLHACITMTCYNTNYKNVFSIFTQKNISNTIGEVLEKEGKKQIRIAETEKYPHVTFFFSGGRETPFNNETRILCQSPKVKTYDLKPEMSAMKITKNTITMLEKNEFDFFCINFANPDMVGHTGNMKKTIEACEVVDYCVKLCSKKALNNLYSVIIVGDHGNADYMINKDGSPNTTHSTSLVPFILLDNDKNIINRKKGALCDVAPTILYIMNLPIPNEMTGIPIIKKL
ncbi:2,3-bisphosphoglycerate-independent phosphoglycerate mutase [Blattabacterium cuenoti]|uniref:2,3-bisphosphoglycerate-independent phosphoglycerate mutase n=1 Tax=Blattabacterium cuenoti TaxID=1653831 RepID=UPI00163CAC88|nr:2,3-bisphosphoglycerate-independent phosphoglycerate mutase [Blattabacterium cuenoti]